MRLPNRKPGKYTFPIFDPHMTQDRFDAMQAKLERLIKFTRPQAIKETQTHGENGDFSENAEYQIAKGWLRGINKTIDELKYQLPRAIIIEKPTETTIIQIGHTVTLLTADHKEVTWKILGPNESDPNKGIISHVSPLGEALLGKARGDKVTIQLKDRPLVYTIKDIVTSEY